MVWADTNYTRKKKITINNTKVASNQTDYPMVIDITDANLTVCQANGFDIKFYESTETSQLKHERVKWNKATGRLIAWVKIPSLSSVVNTEIYMYYRYSGEAVDQQDAENTWNTSFEAVWHMNSLNDSTSNSVDLTNNGADLTVDGGKIGDCYRFINANSDYMLHPTFLDVMPASDELTLELWANHESNPGSDQHYMSKTNIGAQDRIFFRRQTATHFLQLGAEGENKGVDYATDNDIMSDGTWYHCVGIYNGKTNLEVIRNGTDITVGTVMGGIIQDGTAEQFTVGCYSTDYGGGDYRYRMDGYLDELRVYNIDAGSALIETNFNNQNSPATFMTFGSQETYAEFNFKFPVKERAGEQYKYRVKNKQCGKYKELQKDKYKYRVKKTQR